MIVSKFGGTSVGSYEAMQHSASIVADNVERKLIVLSATSGTTNDLVTLENPNISSTDREQILIDINDRHLGIISNLKERKSTLTTFQRQISELRAHLEQFGRDKRWKDRLYSFGELMSTRIFVEVLKENGVNAEWLDARKIIKTDSTFGNAIPDLVNIKKKADSFIDSDKVTLTQGFICSDIFGSTTTLGRGGSDYSAALFADAVGENQLEIWTDVEGVYTIDHRLVK